MTTHAKRELSWGVREIRYPPPQVKRLRGFCVLDDEKFASSDGRHITIWTPRQVIRMIDVPAVAMIYVSSINYIIALCEQSPELVFVQIAPPYQVVHHPQLFSTKIVTRMHYFERAGTLVCAGQGLMFGYLKIPQIFKSSTSPNPEMLSVTKLSELYDDILFTGLHIPIFIDSEEIVLVYHQYDVFIHRADGSCVQRILKFCDNPISCVSYNDKSRQVVAGDVAGRCSVLTLEVRQPFIEGARQDPCAGIEKCQPASAQLIYAGVHGCGFLLAISIDRQATLTYMKSSTVVQSFRLPLDVVTIYPTDKKMLFFARNEIFAYQVDIFTDFFADIVTQAMSLQRCPSSCHAARMLMYDNHSALTLFSPKTGEQLFGIRACHYKDDIIRVLYPREIIRDGEKWKMTEIGDVCWLLMTNSTIMMLDLETIKSDNDKDLIPDEDLVLQSTTIMHARYLTTSTIRIPINMKYVAFLRIETEKYPGCVMGICQSGHCNIISGIAKETVGEFWIGFGGVVCAAFSVAHSLVVIAALEKTVAFDIDKQRVLYSITVPTVFTSLLVVSDSLIVCGSAHGDVEIRSLPTLGIIATSSSFNAHHGERGKRRVLTNEELSEVKAVRKIPFSVKFIDYCAPRKAILTMSPIGEIFIWSLKACPKAHFMMDMAPTAACFADGFGSVFVTALNTVFKIDSSKFFGKKLEPIRTPLDEFDTNEDNFSPEIFNKEVKCSLSLVRKASCLRLSPKAKFKKVVCDPDPESEDENENDAIPQVTFEKKIDVKQTENIQFDDLVVEQEEIPKHPFLQEKVRPEPDPNKRKLVLPPMPPLVVIPPIEPPAIEPKVKVTKRKAKTPKKKSKKKQPKQPKEVSSSARPKSARKPKMKPLVPVKANKTPRKPKIQKAKVGTKRTPRADRQKIRQEMTDEMKKMVESHYSDLDKQKKTTEALEFEVKPRPEPEITHEFETEIETPQIEPVPEELLSSHSEEPQDLNEEAVIQEPKTEEEEEKEPLLIPEEESQPDPPESSEDPQTDLQSTSHLSSEESTEPHQTESTEPPQTESTEPQEIEPFEEPEVEVIEQPQTEETEPQQMESMGKPETQTVQAEPKETMENEDSESLLQLLSTRKFRTPQNATSSSSDHENVPEAQAPPPSLATDKSDESSDDHPIRPPTEPHPRSIRRKIVKGRPFTAANAPPVKPRSGPLLSITNYGPQSDSVGYYHDYIDKRSKRLKSYADARNPTSNLIVQRQITWHCVSKT